MSMSSDDPGRETILSIENLTIDFGPEDAAIKALRGVSWKLGAGEVLAIVGESGSGKSVSTLAIMGLLPKGARVGGAVRWRGEDLLKSKGKRQKELRGSRIALVPQDPTTSLNPVYTIGYQIAEGIRAHQRLTSEEIRARTIELLSAMGIPHPEARMNSYPHELSGGMRQRVVIAMAMANDPDLIIADEATTALDVTVQAQVLDSLEKAQALTGAALLLITHDLGIVAGRADRVIVMEDGQAVEEGPVEDIFYHPRSPYTRRLLDAIPRIPFAPRIDDTPTPPHAEVTPFREDPTFGTDAYRVPLLSMRGVKKHFPIYSRSVIRQRTGMVRAVAGVDLDLAPGTTLGIVGESGSGKTTLIRSIFDLEPISGGTIKFDGQDIQKMSSRERRLFRRSVQMVFQDPYASLDPMMTIEHTMMEPAVVNGMDRQAARQRVAELLELVQLKPEHAARYPNEFSGGQRQRIAIARALMLNPRLIVLDEPVSSLDVSIQAGVLKLLQKLQQELNLSYLFVSHDLSVVASISHQVIVMYRGRIVERGSVQELFETPRHPYTRALLSAVPIPDPRVERQRQRVIFDPDSMPSVVTPDPEPDRRKAWFGSLRP